MSPQEADCIFCQIVAGRIPSARIHEDDQVLAFLDIGPLQPGHTLVIPKAHHERLTDMPPEAMAALGSVLPVVARAVMEVTQAEGFNVFQTNGACAGQVVGHVHFHVIPRRSDDGLGFRWKPGTYGEGEMEVLRRRIAAALGS
ncbi:MAG: HIT family protein [Planctomycetota bacterium]